MPGYKTHLIGAAAATGAALYAAHHFALLQLTPGLAAGLAVVSLLATLFPDTDTASKARPYFYALLALTDVVLLIMREYQWAALLGLFAMLPAVGNHRGWTHRWCAALAVPLPLLLVPMGLFQGGAWSRLETLVPFYAAAVLGYGVHLALDRKW